MACYLDTSALVALCVKEGKSERVLHWYAHYPDPLISSIWCVTEFASAMGIKQRTGQVTGPQAQVAWQRFVRLYDNDLTLLPAEPRVFHQAASMTLHAASGLRSGDALHLATALDAQASHLLTLDQVFARNAQACGIELITL
jgi:predicted nucleic acid-binding protein